MAHPVDRMYNSMQHMQQGNQACQQAGCLRDANCQFIIFSTVIGGVVGTTAATPGLGTLVGMGVGALVACAILSVKEECRDKRLA